MIKEKIYTVFKNTDKEFTGNLKEICQYFNVNYNKLNKIIKKYNMTLEEAINCNRCNKIYTVFKDTDREFTGNLREICQHFNINYHAFRLRINRYNITLEEAIDYKNNTIHTYDDIK